VSLTVTDLFCGAGGSSIGAEMAGAELRLGLNHWTKAIETHATNFPNADHDCEDISSLSTARIRRYPDTDILLASPECTNHSLAKGARRRKPEVASLFDDGPAGDDEQDRSRATMWDVVRFAEQKILKGRPYKAIIVENVVDAYRWGYGDDGGLFVAWLQAMTALGYVSEIVWLNSMFCPPTPQSRDRMYVVFWRKGQRRPDLRVEPQAWCPACERVVAGQQRWKKPDRPWGRYGPQYLYGCPDCHGTALPGVFPAASAIDWSLVAPRIGDRTKPLAPNTIERIRRGLERLASEPFAIRLLHSGTPKPLTLPLMTLTQRHDLAMVIPVAGNTYERTPGNRARDAQLQPMDTIHGTLQQALVIANRANNVPHIADQEPAPPILTGGTVGVVQLRRNGTVTPIREPIGTLSAGGFHHGVVVAHFDPGWARRASEEPFGSVTTRDHHSLVIPYQSEPHSVDEPLRTVTTRDRMALLDVSDEQIADCGFRMFELHEIATTMAMDRHPHAGEYIVVGNKRERMAQYGNAVTPPAMRLLIDRVVEALEPAGQSRAA
jgi:DNA (cytosine-5)-methyltransferase 1